MALIKPGNGLIDIRGTFGGTVFKRDSSGLHATAKARYIKKNRTPAQEAQNDWYCQKKLEEYAGGPPAPDKPEPERPTTMLIYQLWYIYFERQRTLLAPDNINIPEEPDPLSEAGNWITQNWDLFKMIPDLTYTLVWQILMKHWYRNMYTYGLVPSEALAAAKAATIAWAEAQISVPSMAPYFLPWLGYAGLIACALLHDFFEKKTVNHLFQPGESIARLNGQTYWARLVGRPGPKTYDFALGPSIGPLLFRQTYTPAREDDLDYDFDWTQLFQETKERPVWWDIYSWKDIAVRFRLDTYAIGPSLYRASAGGAVAYYYNVPVGWIFSGNPFDFINEIYP